MRQKKGTYLLDLTQPEEQLWRNVHEGIRSDIRKAKRKCLAPQYRGTLEVYDIQAKDYKFVACLAVKFEGQKAHAQTVTRDTAYSNTGAYAAIWWHAILDAKKKGMKVFDFGGADMAPTESQQRINEWKARFGGQLTTWITDVSFVEWIRWKLKRYFKP